MSSYILEAVAKERIADMLAVAAKQRLAREAAAAHRRARHGISWRAASRRHHSIELVWPDGVSSVVEVPRQPQRDEEMTGGLAGNRR